MTLEWEQVIVHSVDPVALGQWWATALGWVVVHSSDEEFEIRPEPDRLPGLDFVRLDESKKVKRVFKVERCGGVRGPGES
jgi:hypothetical protein